MRPCCVNWSLYCYTHSANTAHTAPSIPAIRALTSLNISNNNLVPVPLPTTSSDTDTDGEDEGGFDFSGIQALADAIRNNRALTSLNLASNSLGAKGAKHVAEAIKVNVSALRFD